MGEGVSFTTRHVPVAVVGEVDDSGLRSAGFEVERQRAAAERVGGRNIQRAGIALVAIGRMEREMDLIVRRLSVPVAYREIVRAAVQLVLAKILGSG